MRFQSEKGEVGMFVLSIHYMKKSPTQQRRTDVKTKKYGPQRWNNEGHGLV